MDGDEQVARRLLRMGPRPLPAETDSASLPNTRRNLHIEAPRSRNVAGATACTAKPGAEVPRAVTIAARLGHANLHGLRATVQCFAKRQMEIAPDVGSPPGAAPTSAEPAERILEDAAESPEIGKTIRVRTGMIHSIGATGGSGFRDAAVL
jgi:hypothetical protein